MKNKLEIVKDLVDNDVITFEEALILLEKEKEYIYVPQFQPYYPNQPYYITNPYTVTSTSDLESK